MLIKKITQKGKPIPYTPKEAIPFAVARSAKVKSTLAVVYWVDRRSIIVTSFKSGPTDTEGGWEAWAEGTVAVGKTMASTGKFHVTKSHAFNTHYKSGKDDLGVPDIVVLDDSTLDLLEVNPSKLVGDVPVNVPPITILGEVEPTLPAPKAGVLRARRAVADKN